MRKNITFVFLTGILTAFSYPPFRTGFLAFGALIPFFLLLQDKTGKKAFRWGYLAGLVYYSATLYWIGWVTVPGLLGALLIMPLFTGLYALLHTFLLKRWGLLCYAFVPFLWTAIEYLQSFGETAFPWNYLGYTQTYYLPFIQYAEYTSVYGISFWIVTINVVLFVMLLKVKNAKKRWTCAGVLVVLFIIPAVHGLVELSAAQESGRKIKIALLQGNVDPFEKWAQDSLEKNFEIYEQMTRTAAENKPDLFIWPETAIPFYLRYETEYLDRMHEMVDQLQIPVVTGAIDYDYNENGAFLYYNAAFLFEPGMLHLARYLKMKLVPMSERVPYRNFFPMAQIKKLLFNMQLGVGDYARGQEFKILSFQMPSHTSQDVRPEIRFAVPICYESVFPDIVRQFVKKGTDFISVITNDAWFGKTSAPFQHAQIAVMRAVENRVAIARCANTGISCFIDPYGHVLQHSRIFQKESLCGDIPLRNKTTFYTQHGNVFAIIVTCITLSILLVTLLFVRNRDVSHQGAV
jgi:apolipoprotein N-acyltransferase